MLATLDEHDTIRPTPGGSNPIWVSHDGAVTCPHCHRTAKALVRGGCTLELLEARIARFREQHAGCGSTAA